MGQPEAFIQAKEGLFGPYGDIAATSRTLPRLDGSLCGVGEKARGLIQGFGNKDIQKGHEPLTKQEQHHDRKDRQR